MVAPKGQSRGPSKVNTQHRIVRDLLIMIIMKTAIVLGVLTSFWVFKYIILMQSTGKVEILLGKSQNFQNLLPGFSSFTYQYVFTPVLLQPNGQVVERGQPFSPPFSLWCVTGLAPARSLGAHLRDSCWKRLAGK